MPRARALGTWALLMALSHERSCVLARFSCDSAEDGMGLAISPRSMLGAPSVQRNDQTVELALREVF
jgi:hypothetical protein